jgi:hypothetical protein
MNQSLRSWSLIAGSVLLLALTGCSTIGAKPWERARLARASMQLDDHAVEAGIDDHVYFSKEASSGGRGFGGGGCGCN